MKLSARSFRTLGTAFILASGCAVSSDGVFNVSLNSDFRLHPGQSAIIQPGSFEVGFIEVVSDSRCGKGENCITAGDGIVRIWLRPSGMDRTEATLHSVRPSPDHVDAGGFRTSLLALLPERIAGVEIPPGDYQLVLRVERQP